MAWGRFRGKSAGAKFGAKRNPCPNSASHPSHLSHPSLLETSVCCMLHDFQKARVCKILSIQKKIYLSEAKIGLIPDFYCLDCKTGQEYFVEAKGEEIEPWPTKLKLYKVYGPIDLRIYKGTHQKPVYIETIKPTYGKDSLMPEFVKDPPGLES